MNQSPSARSLFVRMRETKESTERIRIRDKRDIVIGNFVLFIDITAVSGEIYIPVSAASGKKPAGFIYQIEGTGQGRLSSAGITVKGAGVAQVTLGTLVFAKVPAGKTAAFRLHIETRGQLGEAYQIAIRQINYKLNPGDARYQKLAQDLRTRTVTFR